MDRITRWADWEKACEAEPETAAEAALIAACRAGGSCRLGTTRPAAPSDATRIRASLLAYLIRGGCAGCPTTERGVWLEGASITGALDLTGATAQGRVVLGNCTFDTAITAQDANLAALGLDGSTLPGLDLQRAKITGPVFLRDGFHATGGVTLSGATIGGNLSCTGGRFDNVGEHALNAQRAQVTGSVLLSDGFHATGGVTLAGATIGGQLACDGGRFDNAGRDALDAQGARVSGPVLLRDSFHATGEVTLAGTTIGGQLACDGGRFENAGGLALDLQRARVTESFLFRGVTGTAGIVALSAAHAGDLVDDLASWPEGENRLILDGFTYDRLAGGAPTDAARRLPWLARGAVWQGEFRPQPYQQLAEVLREMGHERDAKAVHIMRHRLSARYERARRWQSAKGIGMLWAGPRHGWNWFWSQILRGLTGYGYKPLRSLVALVALFLAATALAHFAWEEGSMAPNSGVLLTSEGWRAYAEAPDVANPAAAWAAADGPGRDWESFNRYAYAADVVIPIIEFGQTDAWAPSTTRGPVGWHLWWARWALSVAGWIVTALGAAAVTGIIRKD